MDNWFNSHSLQCKLKFVGILSIGTVRSNRIASCVLDNERNLKSGERGTFYSRVDTNNGIVVTKWYDNKIVHVISNYKGPLPVEKVKRWSVTEKRNFMSLGQHKLVNTIPTWEELIYTICLLNYIIYKSKAI